VSTYSPGGARANTSYRIDQQGLLQGSNSPTDAAIDGAGVFVVNSRPDVTGDQLYTRACSFEQDFLGNLRNNAGFYLQGWALDANEQVSNINQLETVNVRVINGVAAATTNVELGANLDAGQTPFAGPMRLATWPPSTPRAASAARSRKCRARSKYSIRSAARTTSISCALQFGETPPCA
jgi:flagellar hook protein FlgE